LGVNCILIWTQGGTSHHDTFDPQPEAPVSVRGPYKVIDTAVPGVKFTEVVPRLAKELGRFSVLRSWNPRNGSHGTADQYFTEDLAATVYTKLGIPLDTIHYTPDGRPMRLNEVRVIKQWM
jgi:hypothetical protein